MKRPTSFRLTEKALALLKDWSSKLGMSQAAVLELAIHQFTGHRVGDKPRGPRQTSGDDDSVAGTEEE